MTEANLLQTVNTIVTQLRRFRIIASTERELQLAIGQILEDLPFPVQAEFNLGKPGRVDFLVGGCVVVELKIKGGATAIRAQLSRYAADERVKAVILVSNRRRHAAACPVSLNNKPIAFVLIGEGNL